MSTKFSPDRRTPSTSRESVALDYFGDGRVHGAEVTVVAGEVVVGVAVRVKLSIV